MFTQIYEVYLVAQVCAISWRLKKYCFLRLDSSTMLFHNLTAQLAPRQMPFKYRVTEFPQNSSTGLLSSCSNLSKTKSWVTWCLSCVNTQYISWLKKKKKTNKHLHTVMVPWAQLLCLRWNNYTPFMYTPSAVMSPDKVVNGKLDTLHLLW